MAHPLIVVCRVTTTCNLACGFCAFDRRLPFARTTLATSRIERLIALLADWSARQNRKHGADTRAPCALPRGPLLSWLGGEPLLWRDWAYCSEMARAQGVAVSATTNASTLASDLVRAQVLAHLDELTLSIDAVGARHDQLRGWPGGYRRALAALRALRTGRRSAGAPRLRANIVLMRSTIDDFAMLAGELASAGVDEISYNLLGGRDRPDFHRMESVPPAALDRLLQRWPSLQRDMAQAGVVLTGSDEYADRLRSASRGSPWPVADCAPGDRFLFVDEQGRVAPCAFTAAEFGIPLEDIRQLDELPARFAALRRARCASACDDCPSTQVSGKFALRAGVVDLAHKAVSADAGECA